MIPIEGALSAAMDVYFPMQISHEKNLKRSKRDIHEIVSKGPFLEIILCTINIILGPPCNSIHPISFPPKLTGPLTSLAQIVNNYQRNKINHQPLLPRRGAIYIYIYMSPLVFDKMQGGAWGGGISIIALCPKLKKLKNKHHFF